MACANHPSFGISISPKPSGIVFRRSQNCDFLFIGGCRTDPIYVFAYVDDLLIVGARKAVDKRKKALSIVLTVTELGACHYFLGMSITRQTNGMIISQYAYSERIIASAGILDCMPVETPLPLVHKLSRERGMVRKTIRVEVTAVRYRTILGSLIYLSTRTRPEIATDVSLLEIFNAKRPRAIEKHSSI